QLKHRIPLFSVRFSGNLDIARDSAIGRQRARFRRFEDAWQRFQPLEERPVESRYLVCRFVTVHGQWKPRHEYMIRLQPQLHISNPAATSSIKESPTSSTTTASRNRP